MDEGSTTKKRGETLRSPGLGGKTEFNRNETTLWLGVLQNPKKEKRGEKIGAQTTHLHEIEKEKTGTGGTIVSL